MNRDVEIIVNSCDKNGIMISWMFVGNTNILVALVKAGLAKMHKSAKGPNYVKHFQEAEKVANKKKLYVIII